MIRRILPLVTMALLAAGCSFPTARSWQMERRSRRACDLYHYPIERTTGRVPTFEYNADESRVSRQKIEALAKQTGATLWIEHDAATFASLPKAPRYLD
jgi:hypothetical protein